MSNTRIFVSNLKWGITDDELREVIERRSGIAVAHLEIIRDDAGRAKFAFVEMASEGDRDLALETLNGLEIHGRKIRCEPAKSAGAAAARNGNQNREGAGRARPGARRWEG